jgi:predicted nicotinamide N-methyase
VIDAAALERDLRAARDGRPPPAGMLDVRVDELAVPGGVVPYVRPADWELLCERGGESPFWATLWPSGAALARAVAAEPGRVAGRRVVELGCGLAVPSVVAARAGASVLATDASAAAVVFARANLDHGGAEGDAAVLDVTAAAEVPGTFDVVLGADVVYDRRNVAGLVDLVPRLLADGGEVWLADPGRPGLEHLLQGLAERCPAVAVRVETAEHMVSL